MTNISYKKTITVINIIQCTVLYVIIQITLHKYVVYAELCMWGVPPPPELIYRGIYLSVTYAF